MADLRVTCITMPHPQGHHEHITHVGNQTDRWKLTREEVVRRIDGRLDSFYVYDQRTKTRAEIGVVREQGKAPYLRTYADGVPNDNLLALPQCP